MRKHERSRPVRALHIVPVDREIDLRDKALVRRNCAQHREAFTRGVHVDLAIVRGDGQARSVLRIVDIADPVIGILSEMTSGRTQPKDVSVIGYPHWSEVRSYGRSFQTTNSSEILWGV